MKPPQLTSRQIGGHGDDRADWSGMAACVGSPRKRISCTRGTDQLRERLLVKVSSAAPGVALATSGWSQLSGSSVGVLRQD